MAEVAIAFNQPNNNCSTKIKLKFVSVNLTMDSSRVLYADYHAISRFFTTRQSFEILSVITTKKAILTYFRVPLDIKQQYLKSKYFIDVVEISFFFDFLITTCLSIRTQVITKKFKAICFSLCLLSFIYT